MDELREQLHNVVIGRLRKENFCHPNELTGCEVWSSEFDRAHHPVAVFGTKKVDVRDYVYTAVSGEAVMRNEEVLMKCENDACILPAHMVKHTKVTKQKEPLPEAHIETVIQRYFASGQRIEAIAEAEGWPKPYVTRLVAEARLRRGTQS